jgi:hypothetical protein
LLDGDPDRVGHWRASFVAGLPVDAGMSFESLVDKVKQAETALEAKERETGADWRQLKDSWRTLWTPGRIVSVGLVSGFLVGKAEPARRVARGSGALQMLSALAGLFAGGSAQVAAGHAESAADTAQQTAAAAGGTMPVASAVVADAAAQTPESLRAAGLL